MKLGHGKIQFRMFWLLFLAMVLSATCLAIRQSPLVLGLNLLLVVVLAAVLFQWVNRPLRTIVRSLCQRDPAALELLCEQDTEFGRIARLIRDSFEQQQRVNAEIQERRQAEQKLRQYSRALEQSANTVIITDRNGAIEYVNPKFSEITGYSQAEVIGANPRILKSGQTSHKQYQLLWQTIVDGGEWHGEFRNRRKDGALYWESATIAPIRDDQGTITHFVAIKEDITQRKKTQAALHASELKYRSVFATVGDALFLVDNKNGRILSVNPAACKLYGYTREEFLDMRDTDLSVATEGDGRELSRLTSKRLTDQPHRRKDGSVFPADLFVRHFIYKGHKITVAAIRDMTSQKLAESRILRLSHFYAALSRTSAAIVRRAEPQELFQQICQIVIDLEQMQMVWIGFVDPENDQFQLVAHAGMAPGYPHYLPDSSISSDTSQPASWSPAGRALRQGTPQVDNDFQDDSNTLAWQQATQALGIRSGAAFPLQRDGRTVGCLCAYAAERNYFDTDITGLLASLAGELSFALDLFDHESQRKVATERIQHLATHDPLTGLPNRTLLIDRLSQAIHGAHRRQGYVGILFLDLDRFKTINDSLGHGTGDQLLQAVTERLRACIRQGDTLARQGGDEFILVLPEISEPAIAGRVAEHLLQALRAPFAVQEHLLHVNASIGISIYPVDAADPPTLIRFADNAMYQAKEAGRAGYVFFTSELNVQVSELFTLGNDLRRALDREEFVLHYQPQIDLNTRQLIGAEALIRWQHPKRGLIPPITFIPIAEETGLINAIGEWTLRTACAQNRRWQAAGLPSMPVAVNLSAKQWLQPHLENQVINALQAAGLAPRWLELEITESLLMRDTEKMIETMHRLQVSGVQFAVDDFGIGYSSLSYLKRFPVNRLKIDQSFVRDIPVDPDDTAIATAIIQMGKSLRLNVVAEGVEGAEQLNFLRERGCDAAQGYYFSKPLPAEAFVQYYKRLSG